METEKNASHLECTLSDTDLFTPSFVQSDIQHGYYEELFPISNLDDSGPVEFNVDNATDKFIDPANSYLKMKLKIVKTDGSNLDAGENVGPVNYIFGSLFSQVDVKLGGSIISSSSNTYSYRAIFETLLNYGKEAKQSQLQMGLYSKDPTVNVNYFADSQVVEVCGRLHNDLFNQGRLILNALPLRITLHRNKTAFMLLTTSADPQYKLEIVEAVFCIRKVQLTAHKFIEIQKNLEKVPAVYPINRTDVRAHSVAAGLTSLNWDNAFQGQLPNRVFIAMVNNRSFTGSFATNPFKFEHYSVAKVGVYVNGDSLPAQPLKLNFAKDQYLDGYRSLFVTNGKISRDEGLDISRTEYKNGYTMFGFDISPALCNGGHNEPV